MNSKFKKLPGWVSGALFIVALVILILAGIMTN